MYEQEHHEMELVVTHPSGAEEWFCPICSRRFLMQWSPAYSMMVIEPGDALARHIGSKGGLRIRPAEERELGADADAANEAAADALRPWLKWLTSEYLDQDTDESTT